MAACFFLFCKSVRSTRVNCENILFVKFLYCVVYFTTFPHTKWRPRQDVLWFVRVLNDQLLDMPVTRSQIEESESTSTTMETSKLLDDKVVQLRNNLKLLSHLEKETTEILDSGNKRKWQRHQANLETKLEKAHSLVTDIMELKIAEDLDQDEIDKWAREQRENLEQYEETLSAVEAQLTVNEEARAAKKWEEMEAREDERRQKILREDDERRKQQRELDEELEKKRHERLVSQESTAKLPKIEIEQFNGTCLDWFRSGEQFDNQVKKSNMAIITKFVYLLS